MYYLPCPPELRQGNSAVRNSFMVIMDRETTSPLQSLLLRVSSSLLASTGFIALVAFRAVPDGDPKGLGVMGVDRHIYSRYSQNVTSRVEQILSKINVNSFWSDHTLSYLL